MGINPSLRGFLIGIFIKVFCLFCGGRGAQDLLFGIFCSGRFFALHGEVWVCILIAAAREDELMFPRLRQRRVVKAGW